MNLTSKLKNFFYSVAIAISKWFQFKYPKDSHKVQQLKQNQYVIPARRHIEDLRGKLPILHQCFESIFTHGDIKIAFKQLSELSQTDVVRFLCLASKEGDTFMRQVAERMLKEINPMWVNRETVVATLSEQDRIELLTPVRSLEQVKHFDWSMLENHLEENDELRIRRELIMVAKEIGCLRYEKAFWILLPFDENLPSIRIDAWGGMGQEMVTSVFSKDRVMYLPSDEETYELLSQFRCAQWVLHVHNHPYDDGNPDFLLEASEADKSFLYLGNIFEQIWRTNLNFLLLAHMEH